MGSAGKVIPAILKPWKSSNGANSAADLTRTQRAEMGVENSIRNGKGKWWGNVKLLAFLLL